MLPLTEALPQARSALDRILNLPLFGLGRTQVTLMTLIVVSLVLLLTALLARGAQRGIRRAFSVRGVTDPGTVTLVTRLASYAIVLMGLGVALQTVGVDLGALLAAGAFFAIALGFAVQNIAQNFVAGLILMGERTIKPGDLLEVEGRFVRVTHIGLRATVGRSADEEDLIIPNSVLVQNIVRNYTLRDTMRRVRVKVGVSYSSDLDLVKRVLQQTLESFAERIAEPEPVVLLTDFGDSAVEFEASVWINDPLRGRIVRSDLHEAIWWALKRAEITIPFPQRDIHLIGAASGMGSRDPS